MIRNVERGKYTNMKKYFARMQFSAPYRGNEITFIIVKNIEE